MIIREDRAIELMIKGILLEVEECKKSIKRGNIIIEERRIGKKDKCKKTDEEVLDIIKNNKDKINLLYKDMDELKDVDINIELEIDCGLLKTSLRDVSYARRESIIELLKFLKVEGINIDFECVDLKDIPNLNILSYIFEQINNVLVRNENKAENLQEILETIGIETRICSHCKSLMIEGYCIDGGMEYYCTKNGGQDDKCLEQVMTGDEYDDLWDDEFETYWTEWN